jgi:hypothetical protein
MSKEVCLSWKSFSLEKLWWMAVINTSLASMKSIKLQLCYRGKYGENWKKAGCSSLETSLPFLIFRPIDNSQKCGIDTIIKSVKMEKKLLQESNRILKCPGKIPKVDVPVLCDVTLISSLFMIDWLHLQLIGSTSSKI